MKMAMQLLVSWIETEKKLIISRQYSLTRFLACGKLNCYDVWLRLRKPKENALDTITKLVEKYYLDKGIEKCALTSLMYTSILLDKDVRGSKKYSLSKIFRHMGVFPSTSERSLFYMLYQTHSIFFPVAICTVKVSTLYSNTS